MFGLTVNHKNHFFKLNRNIVLRHIVVLLIFIFIAFIFCYQVANFAIVQTSPTPSFFVTFFRAILKILRLPFFWMDLKQINSGIQGGARALRLSFLIYCGIFWGCFVYVLFPSLRKMMIKQFKRLRKNRNVE